MPDTRPRISSGVAASTIALRKAALMLSAAPANGKEHEAEPERFGEPEEEDREPPQRSRDRDR